MNCPIETRVISLSKERIHTMDKELNTTVTNDEQKQTEKAILQQDMTAIGNMNASCENNSLIQCANAKIITRYSTASRWVAFEREGMADTYRPYGCSIYETRITSRDERYRRIMRDVYSGCVEDDNFNVLILLAEEYHLERCNNPSIYYPDENTVNEVLKYRSEMYNNTVFLPNRQQWSYFNYPEASKAAGCQLVSCYFGQTSVAQLEEMMTHLCQYCGIRKAHPFWPHVWPHTDTRQYVLSYSIDGHRHRVMFPAKDLETYLESGLPKELYSGEYSVNIPESDNDDARALGHVLLKLCVGTCMCINNGRAELLSGFPEAMETPPQNEEGVITPSTIRMLREQPVIRDDNFSELDAMLEELLT
jgi:hypothetical protein